MLNSIIDTFLNLDDSNKDKLLNVLSNIINPIKIDNRLIGKININDLLLFDILIPNEQRINDDSKIQEIKQYIEY